jgi:hypothetical protein
MTTQEDDQLEEGISVAIRFYNDLKNEDGVYVSRAKFKFLGQCLEAMKEIINERRTECSTQSRC